MVCWNLNSKHTYKSNMITVLKFFFLANLWWRKMKKKTVLYIYKYWTWMRLFNFNAYKLASFVSAGLIISCCLLFFCSDSGIWFVHFWYLVPVVGMLRFSRRSHLTFFSAQSSGWKRRLLPFSARTHAIRSFLEKLKYLPSEAGKRRLLTPARVAACIQARRFAPNPASHSR